MSRSRAFVLPMAALLAIGLGFSGLSTARADLLLAIQDSSAVIGSTGNSFDVFLTNNGSSAVTIGSFSFEVSTLSSDILFTEANTSTGATRPYIFGADSVLGPTIGLNSPPAVALLAADVDAKVSNQPPEGASVAAGVTVGLGHVLFNVLGSASPGPFTVTFTADKTGLFDPTGIALTEPITLGTGTIRLEGSSALVPEPSALALVCCGLAALGGFEGLRRRSRRS